MIEQPDARITALSEEHGQLDVSQCSQPPQIGDRVSIVPNHICPCINLRDWVWIKDADGAAEALAINARGRIV